MDRWITQTRFIMFSLWGCAPCCKLGWWLQAILKLLLTCSHPSWVVQAHFWAILSAMGATWPIPIALSTEKRHNCGKHVAKHNHRHSLCSQDSKWCMHVLATCLCSPRSGCMPWICFLLSSTDACRTAGSLKPTDL